MTRNLSADVERLILQLMATGKYHSEDDMLREALERLNEDAAVVDEDMDAILEGLKEVDRGAPGMSVDEAFHWILERNAAEPQK